MAHSATQLSSSLSPRSTSSVAQHSDQQTHQHSPPSFDHPETETEAASVPMQHVMHAVRSVDVAVRQQQPQAADKERPSQAESQPQANGASGPRLQQQSPSHDLPAGQSRDHSSTSNNDLAERTSEHRGQTSHDNNAAVGQASQGLSPMAGDLSATMEGGSGSLQARKTLPSTSFASTIPTSPTHSTHLHPAGSTNSHTIVTSQEQHHNSVSVTSSSAHDDIVPQHQASVSVPSFPASLAAQSAPATVTSFSHNTGTVSSPTYPTYSSSYYNPPATAYSQTFFQQQQQQQQQQGHPYDYNIHSHPIAPAQFANMPGNSVSGSYITPPPMYSNSTGFDLDGVKAHQPQQQHSQQPGQAQSPSSLPQHYYHSGVPSSSSEEFRRAHVSSAGIGSARTSSGASYQPYCVPSQFQRTNLHANHTFSGSSIFTANPDTLPDLRYSEAPLNSGAQYGRLPNGKIIELFPAMMRTIQACEYCRSRKAKCTGGLPCERCEKKNIKCEYAQLDKKRKIKTTTSHFDMSAGAGSSGSNSASAHAQAVLSAKVGLSTMKHDGGKEGSMQLRSSKRSYASRDLVSEWQHNAYDEQGHHDLDAFVCERVRATAPRFTAPLPSRIFSQEDGSDGSRSSASPLDPSVAFKAEISEPSPYFEDAMEESWKAPLTTLARAAWSGLVVTDHEDGGDETSCKLDHYS